MENNSNEQQQRACEEDVMQETEARNQEPLEIVVNSNNPKPLQHQCTSTGSTTFTVDGTKHSKRYVVTSFLMLHMRVYVFIHMYTHHNTNGLL